MAKSAVIGIDLGASDSYVAFVGKGIVDIVQNEVSKRATPTLVGFLDKERLLGDAALSMIRSNAKNTCRNFKHLLGRDVDAPDVAIENFWSTSPLAKAEDGFAGYDVTYKGDGRVFGATQVTAMHLTKLKEITEKWCQTKVADCVIAVPSSFSDVQRQAVLDAAKIANLSVLRVMNEHTATALAYGIYRSNDFDKEKPLTVAFCSMGHSLFSVSIVQFIKGKLQVICEKSDKVGGRDMDECLMREFGGQFKKKVGCDPLSNKKAAFKLEDAVTKTKKILSANSQANLVVECLMEDEDFASQINRDDFEKMCQPMMDRVQKVLEDAKAASGLGVEQIDSVEVVGGSSRVPWVKKMISEAFGDISLSTTMNQEESVSRGCALQAAILSPLYKVRDFKVEDASPYPVSVGWTGTANEEPADAPADENGDVRMEVEASEGEAKTATVFPANSTMNTVKTMTFFRKAPFDIKAEFAEPGMLPPGTPKDLGAWHIAVPEQEKAKKVKVKAKITISGTFVIDSAQMVEQEEYEETIKEKRELPPLEITEDASEDEVEEVPATNGVAHSPKEDEDKEASASPSPEAEGDAEMTDAKKADDAAEAKDEKEAEDAKEAKDAPETPMTNGTAPSPSPETEEEKKDEQKDEEKKGEEEEKPAEDGKEKEDGAKEEGEEGEKEAAPPAKKKRKRIEKRFEWVDVVKKKRRTKRTDVPVTASGLLGLDSETMQKRMDEETQMQVEMREIIETQEKKNDLESYILTMRNKCSKEGDYGAFMSDPDREKFLDTLMKAEDWVYDAFDATKVEFIDKLDELKTVGDLVIWRWKESNSRQEWVDALAGTVKNYKAVAESPGDKYGHIAPVKLGKIVQACNELQKWLVGQMSKQDELPKWEKPVLLCAEMERKNQELGKTCDDILKTPKPPAPKEKKKEKVEEESKGEDGDETMEGVNGEAQAEDEAMPEANGKDVEAEADDVAKGDEPID